ncbi:MAG: type 4a pilus biogenesis protein PilO [Candidatus Aminicenantia bacterium]
MRDLPWYGYLIGALVILGLFYIAYYKPKNGELNRLKEKRIATEQEVRRAKAQKKEIEKLKMEIEKLNLKLEELERIIPEKKEISIILRRIQQLASDSHLTIIKFAPKGETQQEFYSEWPISIELNGNYHNLGIFFDHLSRFSKLFNVENISISALKNQTPANTISVSCIAKTYIFKEKVLSPSLPSTQASKTPQRGR